MRYTMKEPQIDYESPECAFYAMEIEAGFCRSTAGLDWNGTLNGSLTYDIFDDDALN